MTFLDGVMTYLQINVSKTKDMFIDFRRQAHSQEAFTIKGQTIEQVTSYKYLGTVIDSTLNFDLNCEAVFKKGFQRLHCLRKLSSFKIDTTMMSLFYFVFLCFYRVNFNIFLSIMVWKPIFKN